MIKFFFTKNFRELFSVVWDCLQFEQLIDLASLFYIAIPVEEEDLVLFASFIVHILVKFIKFWAVLISTSFWAVIKR